MGSPISGGGGVEPPWRDLFTEKDSSTEGEGEDIDLEDRISDHVGSILDDQQAEHGIPETNASEGMNSDLQGRIHSEPKEGFFKNILTRIRNAVHRLWYNRLGSPRFSRRENFSKNYADLFTETDLPATAVAEAKAAPEATAGCCASIRQFFMKAFRKMCCCIARRCTESSIDFCGADPEGPEGTMALALMLRMSCKWSAQQEFVYKSKNKGIDAFVAMGTAPIASTVEATAVLTRFEDILKGEKVKDPVATVRGITKLSSFSHDGIINCRGAIETLQEADTDYDYTFILDLATRLDNLASKGSEETSIVRQILSSLRYTHTTLMGEYLNLWGDDSLKTNQRIPINYDLVVTVVKNNLPSLEEAYRDNPVEYEKKLNDMIRNFFFAYENRASRLRRLYQSNIENPQDIVDEDRGQ
ncbi:TmeB family type III secretion system effector [Chlamydia sp. 04-14]|uniref:TmeB family type III secretion system effector n=1 Tax=Chlamydia TaxID=810 RepID=UPI002FC69F4C